MTPDWTDVLPAPPPGGQLHEAWLTSFDQPDAGLLVESVLPSLLATSRASSPDAHEHTLFFGELTTALEALRGRLTIISSPPRAPREAAAYPWLWRYVSHFIVGAETRAVQHAKLWAFHWQVGDEEQLEIHVSSTNLTASAFKAQLQAAWRITLPLAARATQRTRRTWGDLIGFLDALGAAAGNVASARVQRLITLLGRVECPTDVAFLASIPGQRSAARRLAELAPSAIHVMTPTIGDWNAHTLAAWSRDAGVSLDKIHLKWIDGAHPWQPGWTLTPAACAQLVTSGVQLECLPSGARLTAEHHEADTRWSHAKLYLVRSRQKRRLLVTSANWSSSAWGAGKTSPRNFELGVVFDAAWTDLETIAEPFSELATTPFCRVRSDDESRCSSLEWAEASWDGAQIQLRVRTNDLTTPIAAIITFARDATEHCALVAEAATLAWSDPERPPFVARFTQGDEHLDVDVFDVRPPAEFARTPLPEVDPAIATALRQAYLLQRYGGPSVDFDNVVTARAGRTSRGGLADDYSVQAWLDARAAFHVVDRWREMRKAAKDDPILRSQLRFDGDELRALFASRGGPAAALVAEELAWRLAEDA